MAVFQSQMSHLPQQLADSAIEKRAEIDSVNIVGAPTSESLSISPFTAAYWVSRWPFGIPPDFSGRTGDPLYLELRLGQCPEWTCLSMVNPDDVILMTDSVTYVRISEDSRIVLTENGDFDPSSWLRVNVRLKEIGLPTINSLWVVSNNTHDR